MVERTEYLVCVDCYYFAEYGRLDDVSEEREREVARALESVLEGTGDGAWAAAGEPVDDFSWAPCECCGAKEGGARYELFVLKTFSPRRARRRSPSP